MSAGSWVCTAGLSPGSGLGVSLATGRSCCVVVGSSECLAVGLGGHSTRQSSSGTQALRLGSLRASPWGLHWRQASSTGAARPAPRTTKHQVGNVVGKRLQASW